MGTATVLVVDDERKIRDTVRAFLERERYAVLTTGSGQEALDVALRLKPDLVVLDLMLPDLAGEEVARSLRAISRVPIIMLTAKASEAERVAGLQLGADDYVVKPFSPLELVARVDAVLRRARPGGAEGLLSFGGGELVIDPAGREVRLDGAEVALTRSEFDLLAALVTTPGRVFSRRELVARVHGYDYGGYERTADVHVKNLRAKLGDDPKEPRWVLTVPGVGYKFRARPDA
ncbi:response regulator transcription factor [Streptomyces sp. CdTB01]|uniref:response regulator transcription factor n=1 Tax=Streptomyces sp. CdTB01 TaxID=1725411 RepID=UPI00073A8334|nr:response regulator transcription factor [Streptomyces sp. CdTB01]ALV33200.1 two-component system response regulator [Streptomyces sp. CdTB01]